MHDDGFNAPRSSRKSRRLRMALVAFVVMLLAALSTLAGTGHLSFSGTTSGGVAQSAPPSSSPTPTPSPQPTVKIPNDATALLSENEARTIAGVAKLHWVSSGGVEDRTGRLSSDTRYANFNYAYPDHALRYVEIAIYRGTDEYVNMRNQSFDASPGELDWFYVDSAEKLGATGAGEAFVSNRYARDGSVVRMLGFRYQDTSLRIEVCNLPTADLYKAAQLVLGKLNNMYKVLSV